MAWFTDKKKGFTLVESLLAISILLVLVVGGLSANTMATTAVSMNRSRSRANLLAVEAMEAVESVRAGNFLSLSVGNFHPVSGPTGWNLSPGPENIGTFTRMVTVSPVMRGLSCSTPVCDIVAAGGVTDESTLAVNVKVSWVEAGSSKEINLSTLATYWR